MAFSDLTLSREVCQPCLLKFHPISPTFCELVTPLCHENQVPPHLAQLRSALLLRRGHHSSEGSRKCG